MHTLLSQVLWHPLLFRPSLHAAATPDLKLQATARICLDLITVPSAPASPHRSSVSKSPRRLWPSARSPRALHHGKHSRTPQLTLLEDRLLLGHAAIWQPAASAALDVLQHRVVAAAPAVPRP
eukprot:CAMPEP_0203856322 /NCGR_PEP_ID=MMETSP0359-20131031/10109_1 /ASSEMBLY_ACC=CAM_ASM_000338 /TAXON_ID=268821 /ORGANISM="Scrippsiella Hangoei, Strain SHTV-5" /LENGTH=122 /DNA_ID=CAMNT_0050772915 /DNA_START=198 /DNA_END=563 /DNA_ORIENTATION=+